MPRNSAICWERLVRGGGKGSSNIFPCLPSKHGACRFFASSPRNKRILSGAVTSPRFIVKKPFQVGQPAGNPFNYALPSQGVIKKRVIRVEGTKLGGLSPPTSFKTTKFKKTKWGAPPLRSALSAPTSLYSQKGVASLRRRFSTSFFHPLPPFISVWGSSETARRTWIQEQGAKRGANIPSASASLLHVRTFLSVHRPKSEPYQHTDRARLGYFLAGLIDSDGHIDKQPQLVIAFHSLEVGCAYWVKSAIGYGHVRKIKGKQAYTYILAHKSGLQKIAELVHNKLRHPKRIYQYNERLARAYGLKHTSFQPSNILSNNWLAGFLLGDGSFAIRILSRGPARGAKGGAMGGLSPPTSFAPRFAPFPKGSTAKSGAIAPCGARTEIRLECKIDQKYDSLLKPIQEAIGGYIGYRKALDTFYYSTVSFGSAAKLLHYLDHYHLIGPKYTQYVLWRRAFILIRDKRHLTPYGVKLITAIQSRINQLKARRTGEFSE
jgi:hypothetical protein